MPLEWSVLLRRHVLHRMDLLRDDLKDLNINHRVEASRTKTAISSDHLYLTAVNALLEAIASQIFARPLCQFRDMLDPHDLTAATFAGFSLQEMVEDGNSVAGAAADIHNFCAWFKEGNKILGSVCMLESERSESISAVLEEGQPCEGRKLWRRNRSACRSSLSKSDG
jgi:hypothetical protein